MKAYKIHPDKYQDLFRQHKEGKSLRQIAIENGVRQPSVAKIFRKCGVEIRNYRHAYNQSYFKCIGPEQAYFLGLISADGCHDSKATFEISLVEDDSYVLMELSKALVGENILKTRVKKSVEMPNAKDQRRLSLRSKEIVGDLVSWGITERKSLTLKWPSKVEESGYIWDYIRGYFDGDGCAEVKKNGRGTVYGEFSILGSKPWIEEFAKCVLKEGIDVKICALGKIWQATTNKIDNIHKLYSLMYSSKPSLFLIRKKNKLKTILDIKCKL